MKEGKRFTIDLIYGMIGLAVMNAMTSLIVYPFLERKLGVAAQGQILFFTSVIAILAGAFGSAANYGRLNIRTEEGSTKSGDYHIFLLSSIVFLIAAAIIAVIIKGDQAGATLFGIIVLMFATVVRYYADVDFRMILNYRKFCCYYLAVALGYGVGILLFLLTGSWILVFLPGELFGILFTLIFGTSFRKGILETSEHVKKHLGTLYGLAGAYFLSDFVGLSDRLLFPLLLPDGDTLTSYYYYASVVGKIMSLLSSPLNGVLMGHLSSKDGSISRKNFLKIIGIMLAVFILATAVGVFGSHIFVLWRYPDYYEEVKDLFILANAGQVLFFICNTLMVIVLRYTKPRNQIITSAVYIAAFFLITVPLILKFGLYGMAYGILAVNALKFIVFAVLGTAGLSKGRAEENEQNENSQSE